MKITGILLYNRIDISNKSLANSLSLTPSEGGTIKLVEILDLSSYGFFERGSAKEVCNFVGRGCASKSTSGESSVVQHGDLHAHTTLAKSGLGFVVLTDAEYPQRVAFDYGAKVVAEFLERYPAGLETSEGSVADRNLTLPKATELLRTYQDPHEVDKLLAIQRDLGETKTVLLKTIDDLLERNEKLEGLVERSNDLSFQSKAFMKQSQGLNSCCVLL
mmetsp:Transcript_12025/g.38216  ORF Transcript_12025/g.38216 Transcript_12025/m.38216 type:complete len:218 (-) Transcript_12025:254-907(-)